MSTSRRYRFHLSSERWSATPLILSRREAHHLVDVLRVQSGDAVVLFDAAGREAEARVTEVERAGVTLDVGEQRAVPRREPRITLVQAMPRSQKMELIIQKATELGVAEIHPVRTERCIVRLKGKQADERARRWQRIAIEAATQCGNAWPPTIQAPMDYADWCVRDDDYDLLLLASLADGAAPLREVLAGRRDNPGCSIALLVGPEGDLTEQETEQALDRGAVAVDFGELTLRSETAALYGLSVLAYEFGTPN